MSERIEVVGIGNAIVDVLASVDEAYIADTGLARGTMELVDAARARALYADMPPGREISGGSAANTVAGLAALGVSAGFVGKVCDDQLGRIFAHDIRAQGVLYDGPIVAAAADGAETARCLVAVTPDGERTMSTHLGIAGRLGPEDIDEALMRRADWLYLEGYLFDLPEAKAAYAKAIGAVRAGGGRVAFSVSDPFCVARHGDDMRRLVGRDVDLLFANQAEILALYATDDLETAIEALEAEVATAAVTLSADGAIALGRGQRHRVPSDATAVVDTTGAGDLFAAGFLAGLVRGQGLEACAHMGCTAAGEIIGHIGARPERNLADVLKGAGYPT